MRVVTWLIMTVLKVLAAFVVAFIAAILWPLPKEI